MKTFAKWISENKGLFIGMCIGLVVAILFLTIGFWATLLIAACIGVGAFFGANPALREKVAEKFLSLFHKK